MYLYHFSYNCSSLCSGWNEAEISGWNYDVMGGSNIEFNGKKCEACFFLTIKCIFGSFLFCVSMFSNAELKHSFYDSKVNLREYDPVAAYKESFARYDNVYIGVFDFTVTGKNEKNMVYLAGSFKVDSVLKGGAKNQVLRFKRLAHSRCIDKSERSELLRKSDVLAKDIHSGRKEMESVITSLDLNSSKTDCFFAVSSFQGDEEMPYKNKYELVFKQQQYVFFVNNKNLSKDGHINEFFVDLVLYDSVRALK